MEENSWKKRENIFSSKSLYWFSEIFINQCKTKVPSPSALRSVLIISYCDYGDYRCGGILGGGGLDLLLCLNFLGCSVLFVVFFLLFLFFILFSWGFGCWVVSVWLILGSFSLVNAYISCSMFWCWFLFFPLSFLIHECIYTVGHEIGNAFYVLPSCHSGVCVFIGVCVRTLFICMYGCILSWAVIGCPSFFPIKYIFNSLTAVVFILLYNLYIYIYMCSHT